MIQSVYVVNKQGETLVSVAIGEFQMDDDLFGGFVSALQMYSQKISGNDVNSLNLDNYRIVSSRFHENFLVTVHDREDSDADEMNSRLNSLVEQSYNNITKSDTIDMIRREVSPDY
ncbi:MAG: hypothetical protein ACFFEV_09065 [Candidatus Thorarchaeota archaeon]